MRLIDYMENAGLDDDAMARRIGGCTPHAVKKWKYGERTPGVPFIIRIEKITKGEVALRDWLKEGAAA